MSYLTDPYTYITCALIFNIIALSGRILSPKAGESTASKAAYLTIFLLLTSWQLVILFHKPV